MIRFALIFFPSIQLLFWWQFLFPEYEQTEVERLCVVSMLLAATTTLGFQIKGTKAIFNDVICALLQIMALAFLLADIRQHAEPQFFMIFAMPAGYLMFGPSFGVLALFLARWRDCREG